MGKFVDLIVESPGWNAVPDSGARAEAAALAVFDELGLSTEGREISVLLTGDARVSALNGAFRGKETATDVLSFPAFDLSPGDAPPSGPPDRPELLGDIALAAETCARDAADGGRAPGDHLAHLVAHGVLHLLGYDHMAEDEAEAMEAIERRALARIGVADPYA